MSDDKESPDAAGDAGAAGKAVGPLAGERLGAARRQQQITVVEVAKELHLDEYKIRALEENRFNVLGAPVFAKGHLKKYAQLVGVSSDDVLAEYYELNRSSGMPPVVGEVRKPSRDPVSASWLVALAVIVAIATAYWFFVVRPVSPTPELPVAEQPGVGDTEPALQSGEPPVDESPVAEDAGSVDTPIEPPADAGERTPGPEPDAAPALPADGEVRLALRFSGDCWTEVRDSAGSRLYVGMGRAGREVTVAGPAPLSVVIGDAAVVSIRVDGEEYRIADADRRGNAAVLTIREP